MRQNAQVTRNCPTQTVPHYEIESFSNAAQIYGFHLHFINVSKSQSKTYIINDLQFKLYGTQTTVIFASLLWSHSIFQFEYIKKQQQQDNYKIQQIKLKLNKNKAPKAW